MNQNTSDLKHYRKEDLFWLTVILGLLLISLVSLLSPNGSLPVGLLLLLIDVILIIPLLMDKLAIQRSRKHALARGLKVELTIHDPTFFDPQREYDYNDHNSLNYRKRQRHCYSLEHSIQKTSTWALLMPEMDSEDQYSNGWRLVIKEGNVSEQLRELIGEIADNVWKYPIWLEINCYPDRICAFWDEGNWKMVDKLFDILAGLAEKAE